MQASDLSVMWDADEAVVDGSVGVSGKGKGGDPKKMLFGGATESILPKFKD